MGKGTFNAGKFNLILSVRHNAGDIRLNEWRASFEQASKLLYEATNGQHSLGKLYICNNNTGGALADAYLLENPAVSSPGVTNPGLGLNNTQQTLGADERFKPYVIVHEIGHYAYGLGEEYDSFGDPQCTGDENTQACIMEFDFMNGDRFGPNGEGGALVEGDVHEFCYPGNHTGGNEQDTEHGGESCWETMAGEYPGLLPVPASQPGTTPGTPSPISWILLQQEQRFSLVLDKSGSMGKHNKLTETKLGADYWVDSALVGDKIGVVAYADSGDEVYPLTEIIPGMNRVPIKTAIGTITAGGNTSIGGGLREGLEQIQGTDPDSRAASQVIALVTDGLHNTGEAPNGIVLQDLIDFGVRVYTIGVGPSINSSLLQQIATDTGGVFYRIEPTAALDAQAVEIRDALITIQGIAHDNGEVVITIPGSTNPGVQEEVVRIEEGCERATFTLSWRSARDLLFLELVSPEGESYTLDSYPENARLIYSERPYMGFQVIKPTPGLWTLTVKPERVEEIAHYKLFVFSQNARLHGSLVLPSKVCNPGDPITLRFLGYYDRPITGLDVTGTATIPGGKTIPLVFNEAPEDGIYETTFTYTRRRGMYSFTITVKGDEDSVTYARPHWPKESNEGDPIPSFDREYSRTVAVSEEPYQHVTLEPDTGHPGEDRHITLKGSLTHFTSDSTTLDFGSGITVKDIKVRDIETIEALISIDTEAEVGARNITVNTDIRKETIEIESGFQVVQRRRERGCRNPLWHLLLLLVWGVAAVIVAVGFREADWAAIVQPILAIGLLGQAGLFFWMNWQRRGVIAKSTAD